MTFEIFLVLLSICSICTSVCTQFVKKFMKSVPSNIIVLAIGIIVGILVFVMYAGFTTLAITLQTVLFAISIKIYCTKKKLKKYIITHIILKYCLCESLSNAFISL